MLYRYRMYYVEYKGTREYKSLSEIKEFYRDRIDKTKYPSFVEWLDEMEERGIIKEDVLESFYYG